MNKTFVALATPRGRGGIHVIMLGGEDAVSIIEKAFRPARGAGAPEATLSYGHIAGRGEVVDEVLLARIPSDGGSSTVFEVNAHGGPVPARAVMDLFVSLGAFPVSWPRAIRRLDVAGSSPCSWRAHVLMARAVTAGACAVLAEQARGSLARALAELAETLAQASAGAPGARDKALSLRASLLATAPLGSSIARIPRVAILGPPNAGKSTLFNALVGRERVIVDESPGTTRDVIWETISAGGAALALSDSAGLTAAPSDPLEAAGVALGRTSAAAADLRVFLFDGARPPSRADLEEFESLGRPRLAVAGKADLGSSVEAAEAVKGAAGVSPCMVSALEEKGLEELCEAMLAALGVRPVSAGGASGPVLLGGRTAELVEEAGEALDSGGAESMRRISRALARSAGLRPRTPRGFFNHEGLRFA